MQGTLHFSGKEQTADICFMRRTLLERFGPKPSRLRGGLGCLARVPVDEALHALEKNLAVGREASAGALDFSVTHGRAFAAGTRITPNLQTQSPGHGCP